MRLCCESHSYLANNLAVQNPDGRPTPVPAGGKREKRKERLTQWFHKTDSRRNKRVVLLLHTFTYYRINTMMTSGSPRNPNKRQKAGEGCVSIASTMTNLVLLAFMLLAFAPTSSLAEFTNDALEIGDTHAILERSKVRSLFRFFLKPDRDYYQPTM